MYQIFGGKSIITGDKHDDASVVTRTFLGGDEGMGAMKGMDRYDLSIVCVRANDHSRTRKQPFADIGDWSLSCMELVAYAV